MPNFPGPLKGLILVTEDAVEHPIMGGPIRFQFLNGAGMAPVRRILEKSPLQHGVSDRGFRLDPREMTLQLLLEGADQAQTDALRDEIANLFGQTNSAMKLKATRDDLTVRQIDCYVNGLVDFVQTDSDRLGTMQLVTIPLIAPDPTWYYPTQQTVTIAGAAVGTINLADYTADDWPLIDVTGPITNLDITHGAGGTIESLVLIGTLPALETWRFDLRPGYKTLRRTSDDANRMSFMNTTTISAFSTMRVLSTKAAKAQNAGATSNTFTITGSGTTGATTTNVLWFRRYLSL